MKLISVTDRHMKGLRKTEECQATWDGSRKVVAYKRHVLLRIAMVIETFPVIFSVVSGGLFGTRVQNEISN